MRNVFTAEAELRPERKENTSSRKLVVGFFAVLLLASGAQAVQYGFDCITNNSAQSAAIGEAQLLVDVTVVDNTAQLVFANRGPAACSITDVYFYDGVLYDTSIVEISSTGDVSFSEGAIPAHLPSYKPLTLGLTAEDLVDSADSNKPTMPKGVNPGESLTINLGMLDGIDLDAILTALNRGTFVVGIHVQGFDNGKSESYIATPPGTPVPEPCTLALVGLGGLLGLGGLRLRKKQQPAAQTAGEHSP